MKYQKGDLVTVKNQKSEKKIVDFEIIENQEIYYMDDKTSFAMHQIDKKISVEDIIELKSSEQILSSEFVEDLGKKSALYLHNLSVDREVRTQETGLLLLLSILLPISLLSFLAYWLFLS